MHERLPQAQAALTAGRTAEAIEHLTAILGEDPAQTVQVYRILLVQLHKLERYEEGEVWAAKAVERFPRDFDIWNVRGVMLRRLKRYPEALAALDQAIKFGANPAAALINRGNILLDIGNGPAAETVFANLARKDPRNAEHQRQLGRALLNQGKRDAAFVRFRQALALRKDFIEPWMDQIGVLNEEGKYEEAIALTDKALAVLPDNPRLLEAKVTVTRRSGQLRRAEAMLLEMLPGHEDQAWLHYQLGTVISDYDRARGNVHIRRAVELDPGRLDYLTALIESLERTRTGDEGANIDESYALTEKAFAFPQTAFTPSHTKVLNEVLIRVCAFDEIPRLGAFAELGRSWAETNKHTAMLKQLPRVRTLDDRLELMEQHLIWGRAAVKAARANPIRKPPARPPRDKIRVGFMSSDLRSHPVAYFALPLFEHYDRARFEVYAYSYYQGQEDQNQAHIRSLSTQFRWEPDISDRGAAQMIADDDLDMLVDLGGPTGHSRPALLAYRPARVQTSWLGYPHSLGLSAIDHIVADPLVAPTDASLLLEAPLMMPGSWVCMAPAAFGPQPAPSPAPPSVANGYITFGTANDPYKFSPRVLGTWARVLAATPGSRFMIVRPEAGAPAFQQAVAGRFRQAGVAADRLIFRPLRGAVRPAYADIDIALDTFPVTGGTTTCDALWMGVPTVTLAGEAMFERLSLSLLTSADLGDLAAWSEDEFVRIAVDLAADATRLADLRQSLRLRIRLSPLGQPARFAADFYDLMAGAIAAA